MRLSDITETTRAAPGSAVRYHAVRKSSRPSAIMLPQLTRLASPSPRKESADSSKIAVATLTEAYLERIQRYDGTYQAYAEVTGDAGSAVLRNWLSAL